MKKIAVLGAEGSFSSIAAKKYIEKRIGDKYKPVFYQSFNMVADSVGKECDLAVIPVENSLDGYVHIVLDILTRIDLYICSEIILPVEFSFVGNAEKLEEINKVYIQFKTQGQCTNFIKKLNGTKIFTTESNTESLEMVKYGIEGEGAVIPRHLFKSASNFKLRIDNITDGEKNETRFIVLSNKENKKKEEGKKYKSSIIIIDTIDRAGVLSEIINEFSDRNINLTSVISRPTKMKLGKYHFFIDIEGNCYEDENLKEALENIKKKNKIKILGSYETEDRKD
jgi:prephenate dehydratase